MSLQNNTTGLESILEAVNALPESGGGGGGAFPLVSVPYAADVAIAANTVSDIAELEGAISISLEPGEEGKANEWCANIRQGATAQEVTLPAIAWTLGIAPTFAANTTTEIRLYYVGDELRGVWEA